MSEPTNSDDIIDSRQIIERIEELVSELDDIDENAEEYEEAAEELSVLKALAEEGDDATSEWVHGETLIRDDYFEEYAKDMADDLGLTEDTDRWPLNCIDWERAANELQADYTTISFDGVDYWVRCV
jgi:hypothetical protein